VRNEYLSHCLSGAQNIGQHVGLEEDQIRSIQDAAGFPLLVSDYYLSLIDWSNEHDPIARICIPSNGEQDERGVLITGGEDANTVMQGVQHKYGPTALILSSSVCATYCRFCFRRRFVGTSDIEIAHDLPAIRAYVEAHPEIHNVLISGGDALANDDEIIRTYLQTFASLSQLDFIRFGTRIPVVLPQRIYEDSDLLSLLAEYGKQKRIYAVVHFNHPQELTDESHRAIDALADAGVQLLNQTVLLHGVNDSADTLAALFKRLTSWGVSPYYLFQCRPVQHVASSFAVPLSKGLDIAEDAKRLLSGPAKRFRYVMSHETGKIEIVGRDDTGDLLFKYHQAKNPDDAGRIFHRALDAATAWL